MHYHCRFIRGKNSIPYYIRISAKNNFGTGTQIISHLFFMQSSTQPPDLPEEVYIEALPDSEALVQWKSPS